MNVQCADDRCAPVNRSSNLTMHKTLGQILSDQAGFYWHFKKPLTALTVLHAASRAGLFAQLGEVPVTVDELGARCGMAPEKLQRLLYFLAAEEVVVLLPDGRVTGTAATRSLQGMQSLLVHLVHSFEAGVPLLEALQSGVTAYELRFGKPVFGYLAEHPDMRAHFSGFMAFMSRLAEDFVFTQHRFAPFEVAVDIGGSHGGLLRSLLERHPGTRGILFDLPEVTAMVAGAIAGAPQGERTSVIGGSFFESVPAADLYLLKMILHDWNDAECVAILNNIRKAMNPGARIAVIDCVLPETPRADFTNDFDIAMLVWTTGRERRLSEFATLFKAAGLQLERVTENPAGLSVVEAVAER